MMSIYGACSEELINNYFAPHPYVAKSQTPKVQTLPFNPPILANGTLLNADEALNPGCWCAIDDTMRCFEGGTFVFSDYVMPYCIDLHREALR
jgi:hypothetical protein